MNTSSSITFYCRPSKVDRNGNAPIEVAVTLGGERIISTLPRRCKPKDFRRNMESRTINPIKEYTSVIASKIEALQLKCLIEGRMFNKEVLRTNIQYGFCENRDSMGTLFTMFLTSQMKKVNAGSCTLKNYRKYELIRDLFFEKSGIKEESLVVSVRQRHIVDFNTYLVSIYEQATVAGMMQKLKSVFLYALKNRMIQENPFLGFKIIRREKEVEFLTEEEVNRIREVVLPSQRLDEMRDLFLFQCFTSLSYCDMAALVPNDYKTNEYGHIYINKERAKTKIKFVAILFEDAADIAKKYNYRLPVISNNKYNQYLKILAERCGITKPMHTHIGRHTAACYLLNKGLSLEVVARIMGHATTKITKHYAKLLDNTVFNAVEKVISSDRTTEDDVVQGINSCEGTVSDSDTI